MNTSNNNIVNKRASDPLDQLIFEEGSYQPLTNMKIGLFNFFTAFWFLLMIISGGTLSYVAISYDIFASDVLFIAKFFLAILILITLGVLIFFLLRFRLLIVTDYKVLSVRPFLLKKEEIELRKIEAIRWKSWDLKGTTFKTIELVESRKNKISFSDFEFENFEGLIAKIPYHSTDKQRKIYEEQAKGNLSLINFIIATEILFLGAILRSNIIEDEVLWVHIITYILLSLLLIAAVKRRIAYRRIVKKQTALK